MSHLRGWPVLFVFLFLLAGSMLMERLVTWSDESSYVHLGALAVRGEYDLFGDDSPGHRVPLAYWLIGLTQLAGPSLWSARFTSLLVGCGVVLLTGHVASRLAGPVAGMVASALLVGHGVTVGYLVTGIYYGWSHVILLGAVALWLRGDRGETLRPGGGDDTLRVRVGLDRGGRGLGGVAGGPSALAREADAAAAAGHGGAAGEVRGRAGPVAGHLDRHDGARVSAPGVQRAGGGWLVVLRLASSGLIGSLFLLRTSLWPVLPAWLALMWWATRAREGGEPAASCTPDPPFESRPPGGPQAHAAVSHGTGGGGDGERARRDAVPARDHCGPRRSPGWAVGRESEESVDRGARSAATRRGPSPADRISRTPVDAVWRRENWWHLGLISAWPVLFFVWSPARHAKLLAYVPGFGWLAELLGYRAIVDLLPQPPAPGLAVELAAVWELVQWRYEAWFPLAGIALASVVLRQVPPIRDGSGDARERPSLRQVWPVAVVALAALLGPLVTQPLRIKTAIGYANQSIALAMILLAVLVVTAWRSSAGVSAIPRWAERSCLALALAYAVIWPTLAVFHPLLPDDRGARPLIQLHMAAQTLRRLIPEGEPPVFLVGVSMPIYLAGRPVSPRQAFDLDNLAPGEENQPWADRMGLIGPAQVDRALGPGGSAMTAVIVRSVLEHYRGTRRPLVERIEGHLEARYRRLGVVVAYPWSLMEVWRRR